VTPTESPADAASETESAAASAVRYRGNIELVAVGDGDVEGLLEVEPSSEVAVTSICIDWADSKSRPLGSATVTSPVSASMANASFGFSLSE
jgi:hypothetical protein